MSEVANDSCVHFGTSDEALTHCIYPVITPNKDSIVICAKCGTVFGEFVSFLLHLTKQYDLVLPSLKWGCPGKMIKNDVIQAQKIKEYII